MTQGLFLDVASHTSWVCYYVLALAPTVFLWVPPQQKTIILNSHSPWKHGLRGKSGKSGKSLNWFYWQTWELVSMKFASHFNLTEACFVVIKSQSTEMFGRNFSKQLVNLQLMNSVAKYLKTFSSRQPLTLWLPLVTKTEFLFTIPVQYQAD